MAAQVLIVEDEPAIQELLSVNLRQAGYAVRAASAAEDAHALMQQWLPDLVLMDWMLPGMSGVAFTRWLRSDARTRDIPVIVLSARDAERDKIAGLEAGADDYVTKPFSSRELIARIAVILRRRAPRLSAEAVALGALLVDPAAQTASVAGVPAALSGTEFRLLHFLVTHAGRVYSRAQLIERVWGADFTGDHRTVDVHISRLRQALAPGGMDRLIRTVRGSGYCLSDLP
jgi:two-component system phosphate regulon response regulator PhoB